MGGQHGNWLDFRNTSFQPAYLDSAVFVPDQGYGGYGVHSQENIAYDIHTLDVGQGARIHLVSDLPLSEPVKGTVKFIRSHGGLYRAGTRHNDHSRFTRTHRAA